MARMRGVVLPGDSTVEIRKYPIPVPGPGQVVLEMKASSICGSDIRAIYREHLGKGAEGYRGVIAGHEPAGRVAVAGPNCRALREGDRVAVYHIAGCGVCEECRDGYMIACESPMRAAYGWQRDGGHADYMVADEATCIPLPDSLSYVDGAFAACGFGTVYEALVRMGVGGADALLVVGLGPVGLAAGAVGRALGAQPVVGVDTVSERCTIARERGAVDLAIHADVGALEMAMAATGGRGFEASIDCSGSSAGRAFALDATRRRGRCGFVGEGGRLDLEVSRQLIHPQITLFGSWVTSLRRMGELLERLSRWDLHPETLVTHRFPLERAAEAYAVADAGRCGKVTLVMDGDESGPMTPQIPVSAS